MSRIYLASSDGWRPTEQTGGDPTPKTLRLTSVSATANNVVDPPPPTGTMFGWNSDGPRKNELFDEYGAPPIGRVYADTTALNSTLFSPGNLLYRATGLGRAGLTPTKRINMSIKFDPGPIATQGASSAKAQEVFNFVKNVIPDGWYIQIVLYHEYNLHTADVPGETSYTLDEFKQAFIVLSERIMAADAARPSVGKQSGVAIPVINPAEFEFTTAKMPTASQCAPGTQCHFDVYNNPNGTPSGYKNYGCTYRNTKAQMDRVYGLLNTMGFLDPAYGWGVNEFGAPRRVAPQLSSLNSTYGWGPLSPHDMDGSGMAQQLTAFCNYALNAPVPATTFIIFISTTVTSSAKWNQDFWTAGLAKNDAPSGDPLHQGWPVPVSPTFPLEAFRNFINISA